MLRIFLGRFPEESDQTQSSSAKTNSAIYVKKVDVDKRIEFCLVLHNVYFRWKRIAYFRFLQETENNKMNPVKSCKSCQKISFYN